MQEKHKYIRLPQIQWEVLDFSPGQMGEASLVSPQVFLLFFLDFVKHNLWYKMALILQSGGKVLEKIFTRRNEKNPFFLLPLLSSRKTSDFFIEPRAQVNCM